MFSIAINVFKKYKKLSIILLCFTLFFAYQSVSAWDFCLSPFTVEETIGYALTGGHGEYLNLAFTPYFEPSAKPVLMDGFDNLETKYQASVFHMLGILGNTKEDVLFVESRMFLLASQFSGLLMEKNYRYIGDFSYATDQAIWAIAYMAKREVPYARETLRKLTQPQYWRDKEVDCWTPRDDYEQMIILNSGNAAFMLYPEEFADLDQTLYEDFRSLNGEMTEEQQKKIYCYLFSPSYLFEPDYSRTRDLKELTGSRIRESMRQKYVKYFEGGFGKGEKRAAFDKKQGQKSKAEKSRYCPIRRLKDFERTFVFDRQRKKPVEGESPESLKAEALQGFYAIKQALLEENYDVVMERMLNMGERFPLQSLGIQEPIIWKDFKPLLKTCAILIKDISGPLPDAKTDIGRALGGDDVIVSITVPDTAERAQKVLGEFTDYILRRHITYADNGDLILLMRRIDGKWYWNPFNA